MLTSTLRKWTELSSSEKVDIFVNMSLPWTKEERDSMRESLALKYWITEWTITSLIAHETMRRMKNWEWSWSSIQSWTINIIQTEWEWWAENPAQIVQESTQNRVYAITTLSELTEGMRENILEEIRDVIRSSAIDSVYDYYLDIEAISDYYNIDPSILEQFLRNRYQWLWAKLDELKKWRILTEEDKMNIRLYVSQWVDEKDKKTRRKEMALKYRVSTYVIWAITAWKIDEGGWVVLKKDDTSDKSKVDIPITGERTLKIPEITIFEQKGEQAWNRKDTDSIVYSTQLPAEKISDHYTPEAPIEMTNEWGFVLSEEDRAFIQELALSFDLNNDQQRKLFLDDVFDLFPETSIDDVKSLIPDFPDATAYAHTKRSGEWMWALVEYDNEIKNKWRQKLKEFIDENTEKEKRKDMKVLCLPWIECLEIPLYLELGFKPENIIWVEAWIVKWKKDLELIERFQTNAEKYWIQTRIGKLEKILEKEETAFDVVSLDFLGPININALSILKSIESREGRTIFLTNFQAKRENLVQDYMIWMAWLRQKNGRYVIQWEKHSQALISPETLRENSWKSLKDSRDDASVAQIIRGARAISAISPRQSDIIEKIREIFTPELYERYTKVESRILWGEWLIRHMIAMLSWTFDRVLDDNVNLFLGGELKIFKINLPVLIRNILLYHHAEDIVQHRMYSYNATGTPMITDCLVLEYWKDNELYRFRQLIQFILTLAKLLTEKTVSILEKGVISPEHEELNQYHFKVFDKKWVIKQWYRASSDELKLQFQWHTLASITLGNLFWSLTEYVKYKNWRNKYAEKRLILS